MKNSIIKCELCNGVMEVLGDTAFCNNCEASLFIHDKKIDEINSHLENFLNI